MKCIQCVTDNKLKDRTANQGRCKKCNHPFVFEPQQTPRFKPTDLLFAKAIADISAKNTLFFTAKQFVYFLDKRLEIKNFSPAVSKLGMGLLSLAATSFIGCVTVWQLIETPNSVDTASLASIIASGFIIAVVSAVITNFKSVKTRSRVRRFNCRYLQFCGVVVLVEGIVFSVVLNSFMLFLISVLLGIPLVFFGWQQLNLQDDLPKPILINTQEFQAWIERWTQINGSISKLLPPNSEARTALRVNPDVTAYSFDRLVVCDSATIAQFLIANNFHFENNCAVLSITGYPQSIFNTTMEMLRRNPELKVYALHDCSPHGIGLVHRLRTSANWFENSNIIIFDVGLLPRQVVASKKVFIQASLESAEAAKQLPAAIKADLSTVELEWLETGKFVELESFTPQKLIQVLNRGIAGSLNLDDSSFIFVGDTGVYATESFG